MNISITAALEKFNEIINGLIAALPNLVIALIIFALFYVVAKWVKSVVEQLTQKSGLADSASLLMGRLSRWLVIIFGVLVALSVIIPSFEPGQLIELLGIGGIAVGFAFRDIAQNFLAGILLLLTQPFKIGDQIVAGDYEGTVEEIQTRATVIKTYDGRRVVIPNSELFTSSVTVNTAFKIRRSEYDVGIGYGDDVDLAKKLIKEVLDTTPGVLDEPAPDALMVNLGDSSVAIKARWWTEAPQSEVLEVQDRVITDIKKALEANDIDIPFPIRTVYFHDETRPANGQQAGEPALALS